MIKAPIQRLVGSDAIFLICDVQERFRNLIYKSETVIKKCAFLNKALNTLDIPCLITEQYPKAFGSTVSDIAIWPGSKIFEKKKFSMLTDEVSHAIQSSGKSQVIYIYFILLSTITDIYF